MRDRRLRPAARVKQANSSVCAERWGTSARMMMREKERDDEFFYLLGKALIALQRAAGAVK